MGPTRLLHGTAEEETAPPPPQSQPLPSSFSEAARLLPPGVASAGFPPVDAPAAPKPDPRARLRDSPPGNGSRRVDDGRAGNMGRVLMRGRSDDVPALLPLVGGATETLPEPRLSAPLWPLLAPLPVGLATSSGGVAVATPDAEPTLLDLRKVYDVVGIREACLPVHGSNGGGAAATGGPTLVGGGVGSLGPDLRIHESGVAMELLLGCHVGTGPGPTRSPSRQEAVVERLWTAPEVCVCCGDICQK
mmetsp:Transcript_61307/g.118238  ORF Transcript_61307/g.118238 Transcript_61307/m.118238 type:complete len:247 (-) Transcript_61307:28-768(-)